MNFNINYSKKSMISAFSLVIFVLGMISILPTDTFARRGGNNQNINVNRNVNTRNVNVNRNVNRNRNVNINSNRHVDVDVHHNRYDEHYNNYHPIATAVAVTATVAVTSAVIGSIVRSIPPSCSSVQINNAVYQQCGSTWYQPQYSGSSVQYIVVNPPR